MVIVWGAIVACLAVGAFSVEDAGIRIHVLRVVLILSALGEAVGGFFQVFRARHMSSVTGRPYDPAYHGVVQDFGFYNFAVALLFGLAALDPAANTVAISLGVVLYAVHGGTHVLRSLGIYYGGETRIPGRSPATELRDGLPLVAACVGFLLFFP